MTKYMLSSSVAALMISAVPALATEPTMSSGDTNVQIDQSIDQTQTQDCSGTAMGTDGHQYAMTTTSSGDCVAVQIGVNDVDVQGSFNGQTTGDRTLVITQDVDQDQTQTGGGSGDTTAVQAGGNFVDIRGSFNGPTNTGDDHDDGMNNDDDHDDGMNDDDHDDYDDNNDDHDDGMNNDDDHDGDMDDDHDGDMDDDHDGDMDDHEGGNGNGNGNGNDRERRGNNGYGNGGEDGSPNGKQDETR